MANVTYKGTPVYIQHVNNDSETARIFPLGDSQKEHTVQVSDLIEH
ncbi:H-type small acid-soluble spore protein [Bacillus tamaricis]|uniref:H-type small acid-soluble spore protein n=2 Tax=Evansella tamaricis TaxID=2069301 RepID=A0ABS6JNN9_9BACI|nr:H-type small acid-soluble spore protein [Evansella tamaricis]MBU9714020.1 H-type small acid-soluble spore protein [Evansella tamaricis]